MRATGRRGRRCKKREGRERAVRVIACIVAQPLESSVGVGFSRQTLPGDLQVLIAVKRDADMRDSSESYLLAGIYTRETS